MAALVVLRLEPSERRPSARGTWALRSGKPGGDLGEPAGIGRKPGGLGSREAERFGGEGSSSERSAATMGISIKPSSSRRLTEATSGVPHWGPIETEGDAMIWRHG